MIRTLPAGLQAELDNKFSPQIAVHLLDVELHDGTRHYWSSHEIVAPRRLPNDAAAQQYKGWMVAPFPDFTFTRALRADYGEIRLQNVTGNTIDREVDALLRSGGWRGAYSVYRRHNIPADGSSFEVHGFLSDRGDMAQPSIWLRINQLLNPSRLRSWDFRQTRNCHFRFTSGACGYGREKMLVGFTTADIFSASTIGNSGLSLTPDLYKTQACWLIGGTGQPQIREITTHTGTTFTVTPNWSTIPDGTSVFFITGRGSVLADFQQPTSGGPTSITLTGAGWGTNAFQDQLVCFVKASDGSGFQTRRITGNTSDTINFTPAASPAPDSTWRFWVAYRTCPLDRASCNDRAVIERFPGLIQLTSDLSNMVTGP